LSYMVKFEFGATRLLPRQTYYSTCTRYKTMLCKERVMPRTKHPSKGKKSTRALSIFGVAGLSLAAMPSQAMTPLQATPLGEEEITDVTLATFHIGGNENTGVNRSFLIEVRGCGGCGGHGCGGCGGHGCGGGGGARGCAAGLGCAIGRGGAI